MHYASPWDVKKEFWKNDLYRKLSKQTVDIFARFNCVIMATVYFDVWAKLPNNLIFQYYWLTSGGDT